MPPVVGVGNPTENHRGDVEAGLAAAEKQIDAIYETPPQYHNAMEPHAIVAAWNGDNLQIDMPTQGLMLSLARVAELFGIAHDKIHIRSPFLGGGFGSKGLMAGPPVLGIMAAKLVGKPVKLVLRREQMYGPVGHRAPTRQRLRIGTDGEGRLTALDHHARTVSSTFDDFYEPAADASHTLYASPSIRTSHDAVRVNTGTPLFMRAPGEATGSIALESAIDEMAWACGIDPLAFRLKNYAEVEPITGKPFSSKALRACYEQGAARFGWSKRSLQPRQMRDDAGLLVGWGMGTATFPALMFQAEARAVHPPRRLAARWRSARMTWGRAPGRRSPRSRPTNSGSTSTVSSSRLVHPTCPTPASPAARRTPRPRVLRSTAPVRPSIAKLADLATNDERSPLFGAGNAGVIARDGRLIRRDDESRGESYVEILARAGVAEVEARGTGAPNPAAMEEYAMHAHGAVFAEVKVDPELGQVRVTRMVGAFAAGRIVNPHLVKSQLFGGMIWGMSFALHEEAITDRRSGRIMNANLGEYHIPVNADVPPLDVITVEEHDPHVNALGIKGVGEIGITGSAGAVANAVWHATGVRVRRFPIKIEELLTQR